MTDLTIVAHIIALPEHIDHVRSQLETLIPATRVESGCVQYDLHQCNDDPAHFMFFENWSSREQWQAHMASEHLRAFGAETDGAVESVTIYEMTMIA